MNDVSTAEVNAEVDTALTDYDGPTDTEMTAAFTEIKGATWSASTDTLEDILDAAAGVTLTTPTISVIRAATVQEEPASFRIAQYQSVDITRYIYDSEGTAIDLSLKTLRFEVGEKGEDALVSLTTIVVSGDDDNIVTITGDNTATQTAGWFIGTLWDENDVAYVNEPWEIVPSARASS